MRSMLVSRGAGRSLMLAALFCFPLTATAQGTGVGGMSFSGFLYGSDITSGTSTLAFGNGGDVDYTEFVNGGPTEFYSGEFSQWSLSAFTKVSMRLNDGSPDGEFVGNGTVLFGSIAVIRYNNPDYSNDWVGFYTRSRFRSGPRAMPSTGGGGVGLH